MKPSNHPRRRVLAALGAIAATALLVTGCAGAPAGPSGSADPSATAAPFPTIEPGKLTVAVLNGNNPRSALEGNTITGTWGWLITRFAERYGLELVPQATDIKGGVLAVQNGRADVGGVAYYTDERAAVVRFTVQDTYDSAFLALPKGFKYNGPDSVKDLRIGVPSSYAQVPILETFFPNLEFLESPAAGVEAIRNGQIDGFFGTNALLALVSANDPDIQLAAVEEGDFGLPLNRVHVAEGPFVPCGNQALLDAYNAFYEEVAQSDEYKQVWLEEWSKTSAPKDVIMSNMVLTFEPMPDQCA